jgi:energy-converting hydrogenase A subunit M
VRDRRKDYATNRLSLTAKEVRTLYRKRQEVEEVIRVLKSHVSLAACQAGDRRSSEAQPLGQEGAQEHHIALCLVAYLIVERERLDRGNTWRQRKRQLIITGPQHVSPALKQVREAA